MRWFLYVFNYYTAEVNDEIDNPPIGLILCTDKGNVANINSVEATISSNNRDWAYICFYE